MKRIKYLFFSLLLLFSMIGFAKANTIYSIDITAVLDEDGNAKITEVWDMSVDKGTEVYKPMGSLGNSEISNFHVSENGKLYNYQTSWNTSGTLDTKRNKNGINYTGGGIELCWGMGSYGRHTYTLTYDVSNIIYNVDDAQVLYWKFVNDSMNPAPKTFTVTVKGPNYYEDTLDVWGYGYKGYAYVDNGIISMSNVEDRNFTSDEYAVLLVKYPLETFKTDNHISDYHTFNDFYTKAEEGTFDYDYGNKPSFWSIISIILSTIFNIIFSFLPFIIMFIIICKTQKSTKYIKTNIDKKNLNNFRDIPCEKNLFNAYFLSSVYNLNRKKEDLLGAVLLKWLKDGKIKIVKQQKKKLFKVKEVTAIDLGNCTFNTTYEQSLYDMMVFASKDRMLEENELKKWCSNNYSKFFKWFDTVERNIREEYVNTGHITVTETGKVFKTKEYTLDNYLYEEAVQLAGLKKYLKEFSLIKEKEPIEVMLWEEYLIFAQIFGIAKEVAKQFKNLYPELMENNNYGFDYVNIMWIDSISSHSISSASSARSAAQNYSSGGGGFSSGGGGGGSFGGGSGGGCR